jgi:predicted acyltransferase
MNGRNESLDALRGIAILAMVLSGSIAYSDMMPGWMYHAQVPPPSFKFDPSIAGITWVDLVFPFFLFAMGAAMPLALNKYIQQNSGPVPVIKLAIRRFILLTFFALFSHQMKAWVLAENPGIAEHLLSMASFGLLFAVFYESKNAKSIQLGIMITALISGTIMMVLWHHNYKGFDLYKSDIIIMLLGNMALFGTLIYYFTHDKPLLRLGILPLIFAVFVAAKEPASSWTKELFNFNNIAGYKFDWVYQFYFLKYLFIVIPGTFAGEWILRYDKKNTLITDHKRSFLAINSASLIIVNLLMLFTRLPGLNFMFSIIICGSALFIVKKENIGGSIRWFTQTGSYLLILGLFLEAYEGGIKKDVSTYSYYFVTSGLAFFCLILFNMISDTRIWKSPIHFLALTGKNAMVAYVAGNLLLLPVLNITGVKPYWEMLKQNVWMGTLKGLIFTGIVALITIFFVKRNWLWKT